MHKKTRALLKLYLFFFTILLFLTRIIRRTLEMCVGESQRKKNEKNNFEEEEEREERILGAWTADVSLLLHRFGLQQGIKYIRPLL